jgi:hypothetical protein
MRALALRRGPHLFPHACTWPHRRAGEPLEELQDEPALGYGAGGFRRRVLDFIHHGRGRLTYE